MKIWHANVLTLFPEMFPGTLGHSVIGKALKVGLWGLTTINIRDFAQDKHKTVDEPPYGGGPGMVMRPDVLNEALETASLREGALEIYLSPRGMPLTQDLVERLASSSSVTLLCGRYEGVDERLLVKRNMLEISLGDYVLSGGEVAAMVLIEAIVRLLPGVMGHKASGADESFQNGLLEYPQYTKPRLFQDLEVPEVLLEGHHQKIKDWRQQQSEILTQTRRPDLWERYLEGHKKD